LSCGLFARYEEQGMAGRMAGIRMFPPKKWADPETESISLIFTTEKVLNVL
jgi:hypothetical protein